MTELKPTLNCHEICRWLPDRDQTGNPNTGTTALVMQSRPDGVLTLWLLRTGELRRGVRYNNDPAFHDAPEMARWGGSQTGGVWDYVVPGPRPGRIAYPVPVEETMAVSSPASPTITRTEVEHGSIITATYPKPTVPVPVVTLTDPIEIARLLKQWKEAGASPKEAAAELSRLTGKEVKPQSIYQRWRHMADDDVPQIEEAVA